MGIDERDVMTDSSHAEPELPARPAASGNEASASLLNKHLMALVEAIPDAIFFKDGQGRWVIANESGKRLFKLQNVAWQGKTEQELAQLNPELRASHEACAISDELAWQQGCLSLMEERIRDDAGNEHVFEVRKMPILTDTGERAGLVIVGRDVTEQRLADTNMRVAAAAFDTHDCMLVTDAAGQILRVNRAFVQAYGYTEDMVIGKTPWFLRSERHDTDFYRKLWEEVRVNGEWQGEAWHRRRNGEIAPEWVTVSAVHDQAGVLSNYVISARDLSESKKAEAERINLSYYDTLTGLGNRKLLLERIAQCIANCRQTHSWAALMVIDVDHFRMINDGRGHATGDHVLSAVAQRIRACVGPGVTVGRSGGDEFMVLMEDLNTDAEHAVRRAEIYAERIREAICRAIPTTQGASDVQTSASIGVTMLAADNSPVDAVRQIDLALERAISHGGNTIRFFSPTMQAAFEARIGLERDLRRALTADEMVLNYQPQVDCHGQLVGVEALLRWRHPERGLLLPGEFISHAEATGWIVPLGDWAIEQACRQLQQWQAAGFNVCVSVNVGARQFHEPDFVGKLEQTLHRHRLDARWLKLELTEATFAGDLESIAGTLTDLRALGVLIALDDFGTGYSSLSYLANLPLTDVKIDRAFVHQMLVEPRHRAIVETVIAVGKVLGLTVVAEGVETLEQQSLLTQLGCDVFQGYYISVPLDPAVFLHRYAAAA